MWAARGGSPALAPLSLHGWCSLVAGLAAQPLSICYTSCPPPSRQTLCPVTVELVKNAIRREAVSLAADITKELADVKSIIATLRDIRSSGGMARVRTSPAHPDASARVLGSATSQRRVAAATCKQPAAQCTCH